MTEQKINVKQIEQIIKELPVLTPALDLFYSPAGVLIFLFVYKQLQAWFENSKAALQQRLLFSQRKDRELNLVLDLIRETVDCDRVILGLISNGEKVGKEYHLRKLVMTHESLSPSFRESLIRQNTPIYLTGLKEELVLYQENPNTGVVASVDMDLAEGCRYYLDTKLKCHSTWTFILKHKEVEIGFVGFHWKEKADESLLGNSLSLDRLFKAKTEKDWRYYRNQIINIVTTTKNPINWLQYLHGFRNKNFKIN